MKVFFDIITNHTADVIVRASRAAALRLRLEGGLALQGRRRQRLRRPRLRRHGHVPGARPGESFPFKPVSRPARSTSRSRPGSTTSRSTTTAATRRSPARTPLRRLLRPRRPVHREPEGRPAAWRTSTTLDPRLRRRRLPDRHDEARQPRVLAAVPAAHPADRAGRRASRTSSRSARSSDTASNPFLSRYTTAGRSQAVLDFPFQQQAREFAASHPTDQLRDALRAGRLVHRRGLQRLPAADVPGQPRHGPHRDVPARRQRGRAGVRAARARPARPRADVPRARQPGRLLRRRAGLHRRRRRPGRAPGHVRQPGPGVRQPRRRRDRPRQRAEPQRRRQERRHRLRRHAGGRQLRPLAPALSHDRRARARCATGTRRWPTAPSRRASPPRRRASSRSRVPTRDGRSSTSSR